MTTMTTNANEAWVQALIFPMLRFLMATAPSSVIVINSVESVKGVNSGTVMMTS